MPYVARLLVCLVITSSIVPKHVWAQENAPAANEEGLSNVFALFSPESTVTSASNAEESISTAPSSMTVFTHADIINMGVRSVQELMNYVPGFQSNRNVDSGDLLVTTARGVPVGGSIAYVLLVVDGVRLNELVGGSMDLLGSELNVDNIKRIEVIRGPGSAIYGANAFFGLINITTLDNLTYARAEVGSNQARGAFVNLAADKAGVRFWGSARVASDQGAEYDKIPNASGDLANTRDPGFRGDVTANVSYEGFRASFRHAQRQYGGPHGGFVSIGMHQQGLSHIAVAQSSLRLSYAREVAPNFSFDAGLSYGTDSYDLELLTPPQPVSVMAGALYYADNWILTGNLHWQLHPSNTLSFGFVGMRNNLTNVSLYSTVDPGTGTPLPTVEIFREKATEWVPENKPRYVGGLYLQDKWDVLTDLFLTAGLRLDAYNDFGLALSPRAALTYKTPWRSFLKVMYGHAFSAPTYQQLFGVSPFVVGNSNVKPETVDTLEVAYLQNLGDHVQLNITYFHEWAKSLITLGVPPPLPLTFDNTGKFSPQGIEFAAHVQATSNLVFYGTVTRILGESLQIPDTFASLVINARLAGFNLNLSGIGRGATAAVPDQKAYGMANARLAYEFTDSLSAFVNVRNMTNSKFQTYSALMPKGVHNQPITFYAGILAEL